MAEQEADRGRANRDVHHSFHTRQAEKGAGSLQLRWWQKCLLLPVNRAQVWGSSHSHRLVGSCLCPCAGCSCLLQVTTQGTAVHSHQLPCAFPAEFSLHVRDPGLFHKSSPPQHCHDVCAPGGEKRGLLPKDPERKGGGEAAAHQEVSWNHGMVCIPAPAMGRVTFHETRLL